MQRFQFHPVIAQWFEQKFGSPTAPQEQGWPAIQSGANRLLLRDGAPVAALEGGKLST